jgi:hypothetical protein
VDIRWDIRREGRAWTAAEFRSRMELTPEKLEAVEGKLLWTHEDRVRLLGLLLENVGADEAVKLGAPWVWVGAALNRPRTFWGDQFNRWMLFMIVLNCVSIVALAWFLDVAAPPIERIRYILVSATVGIWVALCFRLVLNDVGGTGRD